MLPYGSVCCLYALLDFSFIVAALRVEMAADDVNSCGDAGEQVMR